MNFIQDINMYNMIYYFIIYSFLGWIVESVFKSILFKKPVNSGFLHGPFIPIYGVGAVLVIMFFTPFIDNMLLVFILGFVFMTLMEYIVGTAMEKMFNTSWWDYSENFCNIKGKVCLENSIYWGLLSVFLLKVLHPQVSGIVFKIPQDIGQIGIVVFVIYFFADYIITLVGVLNLQRKVKAFLDQIEFTNGKSLEETKQDLVQLKEKILKRSKRLLRIYPKLTYLKMNRKLRDVINEINNSDKENKFRLGIVKKRKM